jgi:hypothetical protein
VRLLKAVKDKGVINMSRGVNSWRGRKKAKIEAGGGQRAQPEPAAASDAEVEAATDEDWRLSDRDTARRVREQFVKEVTIRMMQPGVLGGGHSVCVSAMRTILNVSANYYFHPPATKRVGVTPKARYSSWQEELVGSGTAPSSGEVLQLPGVDEVATLDVVSGATCTCSGVCVEKCRSPRCASSGRSI